MGSHRSYARARQASEDHVTNRYDDVSPQTPMLAHAAPLSQRDEPWTPHQHNASTDTTNLRSTLTPIPPPGPRLASPIAFPVQPSTTAPNSFETASERLEPRRPRATSNLSDGYHEDIAWANSTQFRTSFDARDLTVDLTDKPARPSKQYFREPRHFRSPWAPKKWHQMPPKGLGLLCLVVLMTTGSTSILLFANDSDPASWKIGKDPISPHVYISVFELLSCIFTFGAFAEGLVITFWRKALQGTTISELSEVYQSSSLWKSALRMFRLKFSIPPAASLITMLSLTRGIFFQRCLTLSNGRYHISIPFIVLGVLFSLFGVASILPMYHRYWDLGRKVSLNPLEIARVFGAPMFDGLDGNCTASDVEIERGTLAVRYGVCERYGGEKVLRMEESAKVNIRMPWQGEILG